MARLKMGANLEYLVSILENAAAQHPGLDWGIELEAGEGCAWSIEVRITPKVNQLGPDHSDVFMVGGCEHPEDCASSILAAVEAYIPKVQEILAERSTG